MNWKLRNEATIVKLQALRQHLPGGTEVNYEDPQSGQPVSSRGLNEAEVQTQPWRFMLCSQTFNQSHKHGRKLDFGVMPVYTGGGLLCAR